jgi:uncharacterized protein
MMIKPSYIIVFVALALVVGLFVSQTPLLRSKDKETTIFLRPEPVFLNPDFVVINVPAVTQDDEGIMAEVRIDMVSGEGRTLMDIDNVLFFEDTQNSIRLAKMIAENYTGIELSQNDIIYSVRTNATAIEGSSAGSAVAISTISLIEGRQLNKSVTMTGLIRPDGTVGKVSNVLEKAKVAKRSGYDLILVPSGQKVEEEVFKDQVCNRILIKDFCRTVERKEVVDIEQEAGIHVVEVANIQEAMRYFII